MPEGLGRLAMFPFEGFAMKNFFLILAVLASLLPARGQNETNPYASYGNTDTNGTAYGSPGQPMPLVRQPYPSDEPGQPQRPRFQPAGPRVPQMGAMPGPTSYTLRPATNDTPQVIPPTQLNSRPIRDFGQPRRSEAMMQSEFTFGPECWTARRRVETLY